LSTFVGGTSKNPIVPSSVSSAVGNPCVPILFFGVWRKERTIHAWERNDEHAQTEQLGVALAQRGYLGECECELSICCGRKLFHAGKLVWSTVF
jgi:hypothetical protein